MLCSKENEQGELRTERTLPNTALAKQARQTHILPDSMDHCAESNLILDRIPSFPSSQNALPSVAVPFVNASP